MMNLGKMGSQDSFTTKENDEIGQFLNRLSKQNSGLAGKQKSIPLDTA